MPLVTCPCAFRLRRLYKMLAPSSSSSSSSSAAASSSSSTSSSFSSSSSSASPSHHHHHHRITVISINATININIIINIIIPDLLLPPHCLGSLAGIIQIKSNYIQKFGFRSFPSYGNQSLSKRNKHVSFYSQNYSRKVDFDAVPEKQINTLIKETRIIVRHAPNQLVQGWNRNMWPGFLNCFPKGINDSLNWPTWNSPKLGMDPSI